MSEKPKVFPTNVNVGSNEVNLTEQQKIDAFNAEKKAATKEIYVSASTPEDTPQEHMTAVEQMQKRTAEQILTRDTKGVVKHPELAEKGASKVFKQPSAEIIEEQMRLRDEQLRKNKEDTRRYHEQSEASMSQLNNPVKNIYEMDNTNQVPVTPPPVTPPVNNGDNHGKSPSNVNPYILEISQPNYNAPFDVIPLPSEGKVYRNRKANIRVAYMTTADENILTSPNLLESGEFLEILINRKILEPELRYKDLTIGDRNAIMIWLRATGYGEMYPITLLDELDEPFETEVNLNDLKTKNLGVEPDENGYFDFLLPITKNQIKFKLLTCGDVDTIEYMVDNDTAKDKIVNNSTTYRLEAMVVEVNGDKNRSNIREFVNSMRIGDAKAFNTYYTEVESGIDLNINIGTPGGGSISTFLPLNFNFFWPNYRV